MPEKVSSTVTFLSAIRASGPFADAGSRERDGLREPLRFQTQFDNPEHSSEHTSALETSQGNLPAIASTYARNARNRRHSPLSGPIAQATEAPAAGARSRVSRAAR